MTGAPRDIDLEALARPAESVLVRPPRRRWLWWVVPVVLLLGFAIVLLESAWGLFEEALPVTVVRPRAAGDLATATGSIVFQAAGWVEPDPFPVRVTALAQGVVEKMLVQEADAVSKGDVVCELVDADARLAVAAAEAALGSADAETRTAEIELANARASFAAALEVTEARDGARAELAGRRAELERRLAAAKEGEASVRVARLELETQRFLKQEGAVGPWQVELAEARRDAARSRQATLEAAAARVRAEVQLAQARLARAEGDFKLRLDERLRTENAEASLARARAAAGASRAALDEARLRLERMRVRSPVDGIVLLRDAHPGLAVGPGARASAVCTLYDPAALRVRVDVPQGQALGASVGQRAEIRCDARRGNPYGGRVLRLVEAADIQKVTLEVQVRVLQPDARLKPDMLCQVSVFAAADPAATGTRTVAVRIPAHCLATEDAVWIVDGTSGRAALRRVRTGARTGEDVVVIEGLDLSDKVIDGGAGRLEEGARIKVVKRP